MNSVTPPPPSHSSRFVSIGVAASLLGLCTKTLRRWDAEGSFKPAFRISGNHRRYDRLHILAILRHHLSNTTNITPDTNHPFPETCSLHAALYTRVSSSRQKNSGELARQQQSLRDYCNKRGYHISAEYSDVGSGLNDRRRGLLTLLRDVSRGYHDLVVVNYHDRRSRFGLHIITAHLSSWGVALEVVNPTAVVPSSSHHAELITDLTSILYSFMGRLYRMRRGPPYRNH
jgi:putative resolvase